LYIDCGEVLLPQEEIPLDLISTGKELESPLVVLHHFAEVMILIDADE
jgi:hypothetical protein